VTCGATEARTTHWSFPAPPLKLRRPLTEPCIVVRAQRCYTFVLRIELHRVGTLRRNELVALPVGRGDTDDHRRALRNGHASDLKEQVSWTGWYKQGVGRAR
jgi:hypothetical protein